MPANIASTAGRYNAMYVDKPAWHGLGTVVQGAQSPIDAMRLAGTDYVVAKAPVMAVLPDAEPIQIGGYRATFRTDTNQVLGVVSDDYQVVQNVTPMQMLGEIVKTKEAGIVAHAALGRGERLFAVLDLKRLSDIKLPGDPSTWDAYLVAQWWHNGAGALSIGPSLVRVECQNMANAQLAYAERQGRLARIVHRGDMGEAVEEAQRILGYAERNVDAFMSLMQQLNDVAVENKYVPDFTEALIPIPTEMERKRSREEAREAIAHLYLASDKMVGVPRTAYRLFQAVTEYADHYRPLRVGDENLVPARRFTTAIDGPAADMKADALRLIRQMFEVS